MSKLQSGDFFDETRHLNALGSLPEQMNGPTPATENVAAQHNPGALSWGDMARLQPRLHRVALRLCRGNDEEARDLTQDALVRAAGYCDGRLNSLWSLLVTIMKNSFIDRVRVRNREQYELPEVQVTAGEYDVQAEVNRQQIVRTMRSLPFSQAQLLHLIYAEGYTLEEAAQRMGITSEAVKQRLKRARERFRAEYGSGEE